MRARPLPKNERNQLVEIVEDHDVNEVCEASGLTENALVRAIAGLPLLPRTRRRVQDALECFDAEDSPEEDDEDEGDEEEDEDASDDSALEDEDSDDEDEDAGE